MRAAPVIVLALLGAACSRTSLIAEGPYAGCRNLGDLTVVSASRAEAEQRMRTRVRELGGDTLLFGERGRAARMNAVPEEILARRRELVTAPRRNHDRPAVADAGGTSDAAAPGELWYYGAALQCGR